MSDKKNGTGVPARRRMLRQTLAGSGLVSITGVSGWSSPIVRSVVLPSHAATSDSGTSTLSRFSLVVDASDGSVIARPPQETRLAQALRAVGNSIVPAARAQQAPHRRLALIEKPGVRFDFYLLESEMLRPDCVSEHLFVARDLAPFEPIVTQWHVCDGNIMEGPRIELIDVIDSDATITLSELGRFTLQRDPDTRPPDNQTLPALL